MTQVNHKLFVITFQQKYSQSILTILGWRGI